MRDAALLALLLSASTLRAQQPTAALPDLAQVPVPVLDVFEPRVETQLEQARAAVEALVEDRQTEATEAFGTLCLLYLRYELLDAAVACLAQARALQPRDFRWPYYLTFLYTRTGDLERARLSVEAALALRPNDVPALLRAGDLALRAGEPERAATSYTAALAADPSSGAARFGLGRVAAARGDNADAAAQYEAALPSQPDGSVVHYHLGMAYRGLGDVERARQEIGRSRQVAIASADPLIEGLATLSESREALFAQGVELLRRKDPRAAIAAFERVLAIDPSDAQAHYNLARARIELGELEDAETHLRRALAAWPEFFDAHLNLAILLGRTGRPQEAAEHIEAAVAIDPEHLPTRMLWARVLAERGDLARATSELEAILRLDPATDEARALLVMTLLRAGDDARAREELESSLRRQPDNAALQHLLARLLATCPDPALRDGPRAVALAEGLVKRQLTLDHVETLAMALAEVGRFDDAIVWQRRALEREAAIGASSREPAAPRALPRSPAGARALDRDRAGGEPTRRRAAEMTAVAKHRATVALSLAAAGLVVAALAGPEVSPSPQSSGPRIAAAGARAGIGAEAAAESHRRMLAVLRDIAERTDAENPWLGEGRRDAARARLEEAERGGDEVARFRALLDLAENDLRMGEESVAIEHFAAAYAALPGIAGRIDPREAARAVFRLGVAHLRYGESQNCAARHTAQSCILPIRGTGVHTDQRGSRSAIHYFEEVMTRVPESSPLFIKTVWLLNIAYMTVGDYPDAVPERYRIPTSVFASEQPFPTFPNVAPEVGVATWSVSGGAALDDFDGDGDLDLLTTTFDTRGEPRFFRNDGGAFVDRTAQSGLSGLYGGLNLVQSDFDNDGDLDAFVLRGAWLYAAGRHPGSLLRNEGDGRFVDVTFASGLGSHRGPTQTGAWADYDSDGDLDLYIGNEHGPNPDYASDPGQQFDGPSELYRNNGDGTFTEVAAAAGVQLREYVKGVVFGDYDNDGDPDLYASVLGGQNHLFRNRGDGTFADVTAEAGVGEPVSSFPVWFWDYDNDGNLDLYVSTYAGAEDTVALVAGSYFGLKIPYELPRLYHGDGRGRFEDRAEALNLHRFHAAMGSNFGDVDNDGWLDFYLGTGYPNYEGLMPNVLYRSVEGRRFADVTLAAGVGHLQKGHAVAIADYDSDGDSDIFVQVGGAYPGDRFADALFQNPGSGNHWLGVELVGTRSNRASIGARIRVDVIERGQARSIYRTVGSGGSFGCNPLRQTLGIGAAERVERLEVWWPASGERQVWRGLRADVVVRVVEPA